MNSRWEELRRGFDDSEYSKLLGMRVLELGPGVSKVALTVRPACRDWLGSTHNGLIMSLADHAFGTATNTLDPHYNYVAIQLGIDLVAGPGEGEEIIADARVVALGEGRGLTEIVVRGSDGRIMAKASGAVLAIPK